MDVVVVGGGIAGGALALSLAAAGLDVVVLEASTEYRDRVRGEWLVPWGVQEARRLGVEQVMLDSGAHVGTKMTVYLPGVPAAIAEANAAPVASMLEGIPGSLNMPHPEACAALTAAAAAAGTRVLTGVTGLEVTAGPDPEVRARVGDDLVELRPRIVVGADGRASTVRRQAGITLHRRPETHMIAGLMVAGLDEAALNRSDIAAAKLDMNLIGFSMGDGRMRIYLCPSAEDRHRFSGAAGLEEFRRCVGDFECLPMSSELARAEVAGPLATFPGDDTWTDEPSAEGVVLIGDAAGHNSPIVGQGLAISLRDARMVRDVLVGDDWSPGAFDEYAVERAERMRRLRAASAANAALYSDRCDDRLARFERFAAARDDPYFQGFFGAIFAGPETAPAESYDGRILATIVGAPTSSPE